MATVAFLVDLDRTVLNLGPAVADALSQLGVTRLAMYRDAETACLVLDGWAFDTSSSSDAARVMGIDPGARMLRPVMQTAIRADTQEV